MINKTKGKKFLCYLLGIGILLLFIYYNIFLSLLWIFFVLLSAYSIGMVFHPTGDCFEIIIYRLAIGLGALGMIIYYILFFGLGSQSVYCAIVFLPILCMAKHVYYSLKAKEFLDMFQNWYLKTKYLLWTLIPILLFYILYGSAPMDKADILTKHLPIVNYTVDLGTFNTNVTESLVYPEPMVMQYTFSTVFKSMGANKALTLFNVILFFVIFFIVLHIIRMIYANSSVGLLTGLYFTTPIFFEFSTSFYLEILPLFFLFSALSGVGQFNKKIIWKNITYIAFLCGCSVFTKLTASYTILAIGIVLILYIIVYGIKEKLYKELARKFLLSSVMLISPWIVSIVNIWYKTGNPLFPFWNELFKSPYFSPINFIDPFKNQLDISLNSLVSIVFKTSQNIEMYDGGIGIFLLLVVLIPPTLILYRKRNLLIWSGISLAAYALATIFTYNLRYYMSIIMLFLCLIVISISVILDRIKFRRFLLLWSTILLIFPNILYIKSYYQLQNKLVKNEAFVATINDSILCEIPNNKRVFSINDDQKGNFKGFFVAYNWHSTYIVNKISTGQISLNDYLKSFDYVLYRKNVPVDKNLKIILDSADSLDSLTEIFAETSTHILYKIKDIIPRETILNKKFDKPLIGYVKAPIVEMSANNQDYYIIKQDVENKTNHPIPMHYQINWMTEAGELIDVSTDYYLLQPGRHKISSCQISSNKNSELAYFYITLPDEGEASVYAYQIEGYKKIDIIENEKKIYKNRDLLR